MKPSLIYCKNFQTSRVMPAPASIPAPALTPVIPAPATMPAPALTPVIPEPEQAPEQAPVPEPKRRGRKPGSKKKIVNSESTIRIEKREIIMNFS